MSFMGLDEGDTHIAPLADLRGDRTTEPYLRGESVLISGSVKQQPLSLLHHSEITALLSAESKARPLKGVSHI